MIEPTTKTRRAKRGTAKLAAEKQFMLADAQPPLEADPSAPKRGRPRAKERTDAKLMTALSNRLKIATDRLMVLDKALTESREERRQMKADFDQQADWYRRNRLELEEAVATQEAFLVEALKRVATFEHLEQRVAGIEQLEQKVERQAEKIVDLRAALDRATQDVVKARTVAASMRQAAFPRGPQFSWERD